MITFSYIKNNPKIRKKDLINKMKKDIIIILAKYDILDEKIAEEIAELIYRKTKTGRKIDISTLILTLKHLDTLIRYILTSQYDRAFFKNTTLSLRYKIPIITQELKTILEGA